MMYGQMPKVSVCIPVYNRAKLFRSTLNSVLRQTFTDFEVVVSDNASEEDVKGIVTEANDPRIRFFQHEKNIGGAANFRSLQTHPRGEYVLYLCSDDLLMPTCLEKSAGLLDVNPSRGGVVYMAAHYGEKGFEFFSTMPAYQFADGKTYKDSPEVSGFSFVSPSLCLYRRKTFEDLGGWNPHLLAVIDWEMYSRTIRDGGGICYLHEPLAIMRLHKNRHSNTSAPDWDFFHDVVILANQKEHKWSAAYQAKVVAEQLILDLRRRRSPKKTLEHAWRYGSLKRFLLVWPFEFYRRFSKKISTKTLNKWGNRCETGEKQARSVLFDQNSFDAFWNDITSTEG